MPVEAPPQASLISIKRGPAGAAPKRKASASLATFTASVHAELAPQSASIKSSRRINSSPAAMSFSRSKSDTGRSPTGAATASFKLSASQPALNGSARGTVKLRAAAATLSSARRASLRVGDGAMTTMATPAPATPPAKPSIEYEFAVSRASASVAEACEHQVKHVKTALALACNSELDVLRKLLKQGDEKKSSSTGGETGCMDGLMNCLPCK